MTNDEIFKFSVNTILVCIVLISIYILYNDYKYENEKSCDFIQDHKEFEQQLDKYENSHIYQKYSNLSDDDKLFINDYVNYIRLKYKKEKPTFYNKCKKIRNQVLFSSIVAFLFASSLGGFSKSLKQNSILYFLTSNI